MKGRRTIRAWAVIFWLFLWQSGAMVINQRIILVSPLRVLARLAELAPTPEFWGAIGYSLVRITAGFLLGVAAGTLLAALSARFRRVEELAGRQGRPMGEMALSELKALWAQAKQQA